MTIFSTGLDVVCLILQKGFWTKNFLFFSQIVLQQQKKKYPPLVSSDKKHISGSGLHWLDDLLVKADVFDEFKNPD